MKGLYMFYIRLYLVYTIYMKYSTSINHVCTCYMTFLLSYTRYILGIWQVYTGWLVLTRWTWTHAARATSNNITGPCHYCNSFRLITFAHFTFAHVSVYCPFRHKERPKSPFFARMAHKACHLGQYRRPIRYKGRDSASWIGRKLPSIRPRATTVVAL
jgi:hypothetical protein